MIEAREREWLSPHACLSVKSEGRVEPIAHDPLRTCFQRDRDRIIHSKAFRRLKHKTQVFIDPEGDHYRTRLTHTLEVAQIARTVGRSLRLNEDLIEAIALGHDLGHTPFGHAGESALDDAVRDFPGDGPNSFRHYEQSLRIVDVIERLNLTHEVRAGIDGHSKGRNDLSAHDGEPTSTLEAAAVRISDRIAYLNHDLDDAVRSGLIEQPPAFIAYLGEGHSARVGAMVQDVVFHSLDVPAIRMSQRLMATMNDLKEWMFENVYLHYPVIYDDTNKAKNVVRDLFEHFAPQPEFGKQAAIDYVSGMTDRFAIEAYAKLRMPSGWKRL